MSLGYLLHKIQRERIRAGIARHKGDYYAGREQWYDNAAAQTSNPALKNRYETKAKKMCEKAAYAFKKAELFTKSFEESEYLKSKYFSYA